MKGENRNSPYVHLISNKEKKKIKLSTSQPSQIKIRSPCSSDSFSYTQRLRDKRNIDRRYRCPYKINKLCNQPLKTTTHIFLLFWKTESISSPILPLLCKTKSISWNKPPPDLTIEENKQKQVSFYYLHVTESDYYPPHNEKKA